MREVTAKTMFSRTKIKLFDSVKELTVDRYHELQKLALQDMDIGDDIQGVFKHFSKLELFIRNHKPDEAYQELKNLHNNFWFILNGISVKSYCFCVMISEIGGKPVNDFSDYGVEQTLKLITRSGLKERQVVDIVEDVKKNLIQSCEPIFLIDIALTG